MPAIKIPKTPFITYLGTCCISMPCFLWTDSYHTAQQNYKSFSVNRETILCFLIFCFSVCLFPKQRFLFEISSSLKLPWVTVSCIKLKPNIGRLHVSSFRHKKMKWNFIGFKMIKIQMFLFFKIKLWFHKIWSKN